MGSDAHHEDNKTLCIYCYNKKALKVTKLQQRLNPYTWKAYKTNAKSRKTSLAQLNPRPLND